MLASDGKMRLTDVADIEQVLRLIQSIPSKKAEPFKLWFIGLIFMIVSIMFITCIRKIIVQTNTSPASRIPAGFANEASFLID